MNATPRPWQIHELPVETLTGSKRTEYIIHGLGKYRLWNDLQKVCSLHPGYARDDSTREANARLIVRAVNAHEELLEAAKGILDAFALDLAYATDSEREAHENLERAIARVERP